MADFTNRELNSIINYNWKWKMWKEMETASKWGSQNDSNSVWFSSNKYFCIETKFEETFVHVIFPNAFSFRDYEHRKQNFAQNLTESKSLFVRAIANLSLNSCHHVTTVTNFSCSSCHHVRICFCPKMGGRKLHFRSRIVWGTILIGSLGF